MTSSAVETKKKNSLLPFCGICYALCIILLGINLALPRVFQSFGFPNTVGAISIILFFINVPAVVTACTALFRKNTGALLAIPMFVLAGTYVFSSVYNVSGVLKQIEFLNQHGEQANTTFFSISLTGVMGTLLLAAGFAVTGILCLLHRNKPIKRFLYFIPSAVFVISLLINCLIVSVRIINTVLAFTDVYPHLATASTVYSLSVSSVSFAVSLLYTVAALLFGINFAKKQH